MKDWILRINLLVFIVLTVCYLYQVVYVAVVLFKRNKQKQNLPCIFHRYGVLIAARNESMVIGNLIRSIQNQTYPGKLVDIFVVADNCTDDTAGIARQLGAKVYERFNKQEVGKGYALDFAFRRIAQDYGNDYYDAFFVFDADNLLDPHYIDEMNAVFSQGYQIITSYRNSKNYATNWITAGYSLWFLREAKYLNNARMMLGTNCAISGTGFMISNKIVQKYGGWKFHLLTEDIEFSVVNALEGERIGYCGTAVLYDEQPTTFQQSWAQRLRWSKGFYQVMWKYGRALASRLIHNKNHPFACYDMLMTIAPGMLLTIISVTFNAIIIALAAAGLMSTGVMVASSVSSICFCLMNYMVFMFMFGVLTTFVEWDSIHSTTGKKIRYMFTFPFFMLTYVPIALVALVKKCNWKPIKHSINVDVQEFAESESRRERA